MYDDDTGAVLVRLLMVTHVHGVLCIVGGPLCGVPVYTSAWRQENDPCVFGRRGKCAFIGHYAPIGSVGCGDRVRRETEGPASEEEVSLLVIFFVIFFKIIM